MAWFRGYDFRATSTFVTDATDCTYDIGETFPVTRNTSTFGWDILDPGQGSRDRDSSADPKVAGIQFLPNVLEKSRWRLNLISSGLFLVRLAMGDGYGNNEQLNYVKVFDDTTPIPALTFQPISTGGTQFADAAGNLHAKTNWAANNVGVAVNFTSSILRFEISGTAAAFSTCIAHLSVLQLDQTAGPSLFRGRNFPLFDDDTVNRFEFWPAVAPSVTTQHQALMLLSDL